MCTHLVGLPIVFTGLDEALEYYLNFHMESVFNDSDELGEIVLELSADLLKYQQNDGTITIRPGCFIYKVKRL
jgi:hypothetical protein